MRHLLGRVRSRIHPVVWLFWSKLALFGLVLAIGINLQFFGWIYRALYVWWQSGFSDGSALAVALLLLPYSACISFFGKAAFQLWRESTSAAQWLAPNNSFKPTPLRDAA